MDASAHELGARDSITSKYVNVIRSYVEAMLHMMLPNTRPRVAEVSERLPAVGLLVLFFSGRPGSEVCFA
jgi:hypothetical protein